MRARTACSLYFVPLSIINKPLGSMIEEYTKDWVELDDGHRQMMKWEWFSITTFFTTFISYPQLGFKGISSCLRNYCLDLLSIALYSVREPEYLGRLSASSKNHP